MTRPVPTGCGSWSPRVKATHPGPSRRSRGPDGEDAGSSSDSGPRGGPEQVQQGHPGPASRGLCFEGGLVGCHAVARRGAWQGGQAPDHTDARRPGPSRLTSRPPPSSSTSLTSAVRSRPSRFRRPGLPRPVGVADVLGALHAGAEEMAMWHASLGRAEAVSSPGPASRTRPGAAAVARRVSPAIELDPYVAMRC
jgi:hypothetical protein